MSEIKAKHLLEVTDLHTSFDIPAGEVRSVNGISFTVDRGRVLGIVGESGSGKSVTAYSIMQILQSPGRVVSGSIKFNGQELLGLPHHQLQKIRGEKISIIFQDAMTSLNPVYSIGNQIEEAIRLHPNKELIAEYDRKIAEAEAEVKKFKKLLIEARKVSLGSETMHHAHTGVMGGANVDRVDEVANLSSMTGDEGALEAYYEKAKLNLKEAKKKKKNYPYERSLEMLRLVGINEPAKRLKQYPFEFSGGMLQRIMIAMALVCEPDLLIADEPTTALDVTIQAQILELLKDIQHKMGMGIIIITHDLGVVAQICDDVNVMYAGRIVEKGTVEEIFYNPQHEYTKGLMNSIPKANTKSERLQPIEGNPVDVFCLPKGCSFAPRCKECMRICLEKYPSYHVVNENHSTACFKFLLEAYKAGKIDKDDFKDTIDSSKAGNAAFAPISRLDVLKAKEQYEQRKEDYKEAKANGQAETKEIQEQYVFKIKEAQNNLYRAKHDYKAAIKTRKYARKEKPATERGDLAKKVSQSKKEIKLVKDTSLNTSKFHEYLTNLNITSFPVDIYYRKNAVDAAKVEYDTISKNHKHSKFASEREKVESQYRVDMAKLAYIVACDNLEKAQYVSRKYEKTRAKLVYTNIMRVRKVIGVNLNAIISSFATKTNKYSEKELNEFINKAVLTNWDFTKGVSKEDVTNAKEAYKNSVQYLKENTDKIESRPEYIKTCEEVREMQIKYLFTLSDYWIEKKYAKAFDTLKEKITKLNEEKKVEPLSQGAPVSSEKPAKKGGSK